MNYEPVIGLEVHVELKTNTKLFCGCSTVFGIEANTQVCPVCLGLPGTLPVINAKAIEFAAKVGLALNCTVATHSKMDRKNYFYPDLPKAYQISQYDQPLNMNGYLEISSSSGTKRIKIVRIHLEEDAGKLVHAGGKAGRLDASEYSLVDYNRGGVPLVEIVSAPDLNSGEEAYEYLTSLKNILLYIGVSDCNMEEGSLRCDANVSVHPKGSSVLGTKVEVKNMNSFKFCKQAIEYEIKRQIARLENHEAILQESRLWDITENKTRVMRSKEEAHDYRYFPEPDLVPIILSSEWIDGIKESLPELPSEKQKRFIQSYQLSEYDAKVLVNDQSIAAWYELAVQAYPTNAKGIANWMMGDLAAQLNENKTDIFKLKIEPQHLAELVELIDQNVISSKQAKDIFLEMFQTGQFPKMIVKSKNLIQINDPLIIEQAISKIINEYSQIVQQYKSGKQSVFGFLVGKTIQATDGKANPKMVNEMLKKNLDV
jgi:aspartyl-tRNA(Asn)/glutamyl-tRNA(Gln) amidotransferase subunit B